VGAKVLGYARNYGRIAILAFGLALALLAPGWVYLGFGFPIATDGRAAIDYAYYVATTGNDANPGTQSQPWRTIQRAANTLVAGDTVYVRAGTYDEAVTPVRSGRGELYITYQAYPNETVVVNGGGSRSEGFRLTNGQSHIVIDGFTISGQTWTGISLYGASNIVIRNNTIRDWGIFGIMSDAPSNSYVEIAGNEVFTADPTAQSGMWLTNAQFFNVHHNNVHHCPMNGIAFGKSTNNEIHHNDVSETGYGRTQEWAGIAAEDQATFTSIHDNVCRRCRGSGLLTNSRNNTFYGNEVYASARDGGVHAGQGSGIELVPWNGDVPANNTIRDNTITVVEPGEVAIAVKTENPSANTFSGNVLRRENGTGDLVLWGQTNGRRLPSLPE
jgi:parallel beta-helix repeat protein